MRRRTTAVLAATVILLGGAYVALDVFDVVPGTLTLRPEIPAPAPYPSITVETAPLDLPSLALPASTADVSPIVRAFATDERMGELVGVTVIDSATGQVLDSANGSVPMPPASSTKVLAGAAALSVLGPETRLATTATLSGDRVTLVGGGDILLTVGDPEEGDVKEASLTDLASQTAAALTEAGVADVTIAVDESIFEQLGHSSAWDDGGYRWVMPMTPVAVNVGEVGAWVFEESPAVAAAEAFAQELRGLGVVVDGDPVRARSPEDARVVGVIRSAPVEEIVRYMLKASDNSVTEAMGILTAIELGLPATFAGSTEAVETAIAVLGLPAESLDLHDVCGLSSENGITSDLLASTVQLSLTEPALGSLITSFPVMHLDGTLADRGENVAGFVRAKTGTLSHVVSLTGIAHTDSGAVLTFSAIAAKTTNNWEARVGIDEFAASLRNVR